MDISLVRGKDSTASRLTLQYLGSLFNYQQVRLQGMQQTIVRTKKRP